MYAQQPQAPMPYILPVMQQGNAQQADSFDQLGKIVDLVDKLSQRQQGQSAQAPAPGSSQYSPMNIGQFQSADPAKLALQELLLRNPQLLQQLQGQQATPQTQQTTEKTYSQNEVAQLKEQFDVAVKSANEHFQQLQQLWQLTQQIMGAYNAICEYAKELETVANLGLISNRNANAFLNELNAAYDVLNTQHQMLTTPLYLLPHAFSTFSGNIQPGDDNAVNLISDFYLTFVKEYEEKRRGGLGQYSPQYTEYLQAQTTQPTQQPQQQQPKGSQQTPDIDAVTAWAKGLSSQGFAQQIKRAHTQRLLSR
jgi:hypothetical protein